MILTLFVAYIAIGAGLEYVARRLFNCVFDRLESLLLIVGWLPSIAGVTLYYLFEVLVPNIMWRLRK